MNVNSKVGIIFFKEEREKFNLFKSLVNFFNEIALLFKREDYFHPVLILVLLTFPVHNGLISLCKYFFLIRNTFFFLRRKKLNIFKSLSIGYILEPMQGGNSSIQIIHGSMSKA
jgi:hypothetical protein